MKKDNVLSGLGGDPAHCIAKYSNTDTARKILQDTIIKSRKIKIVLVKSLLFDIHLLL